MKTYKALEGWVTVVKPAGRFVAGAKTTEDLVNTAKHLVASGSQALLVDLGDVTFMDSFGVGTFPRLLITYSNVKGSVKVCNLSRQVRILFDICRFDHLFVFYESEGAALEAFAKERVQVGA